MTIFGSPTVRARNRWDRSLTITIVSGLVLLLVIGLVFTVAYGSQRITTSAGSLHDADESLRSATVARAQLALAGHMAAVDEASATNSATYIDFSLVEAVEALGHLDSGLVRLDEGGLLDEGAQQAADAFTIVAADALALITARGDNPRSIQDPLSQAFNDLVSEIVEVRDTLSASVASSDQLLGQVGNLARFFVAFLVPAAVILIYRELIRRQQRQSELETRLDAERQLNLAQEQFIANASHELRTPLTSILGMSMMLAEDDSVQREPGVSEMVGFIVDESEELARMVEDLLTVARLDAGALTYTFEDIAADAELHDMAEGLGRSGTYVGITARPATVRADRLRFRQVVRNLLSNARKYGGDNIRIDGRVDGRTYVCSVIDDGAGIPEDLVPRLFQRFIHQGHDTASRDSVGLGLSIVYSLALGMGGSITYDRIAGESHFSLRVPLTGTPTVPDGSGSTADPHILDHHTRGPQPATQFTP